MQTLTHNTKFLIAGIKCELCTLAGYVAKQGKTIAEYFEAYPLQLNNDNRPTGINSGTVLCGDAGYYERENAIWANALTIEDGELVSIDGETYKTKFNGRFSDAVVFNKI